MKISILLRPLAVIFAACLLLLACSTAPEPEPLPADTGIESEAPAPPIPADITLGAIFADPAFHDPRAESHRDREEALHALELLPGRPVERREEECDSDTSRH